MSWVTTPLSILDGTHLIQTFLTYREINMNKQQKAQAEVTTVSSIWNEIKVDAEGTGDSVAILTMRTAQAALLTTKLALDSATVAMDFTVQGARWSCNNMVTTDEIQAMITANTVVKPKTKVKAKAKAKGKGKGKKKD